MPKQRIRVVPAAQVCGFVGSAAAARVVADKSKPGALTWRDKLKNYYKEGLAFTGSLLVSLNELTPVFGHAHWFTVTVAVVTAVSVLLKQNETWVSSL